MSNNLYNLLKPKPIGDLIRIGSRYDGGYFIKESTIVNAQILIGLGIFINWEFEIACNRLNKKLNNYMVDASVSHKFYNTYLFKAVLKFVYYTIKKPLYIKFFFKKHVVHSIGLRKKWQNFFYQNKATFIQKFISNKSTERFITATQLLQQILSENNVLPNSIFVKMDIEGSEYDVLQDFEQYFPYINSFAIEWHNIDKYQQKFIQLVNLLKRSYDIVFVHNNNYTKLIDDNFTSSVEITFVKKELMPQDSALSLNYQQLYANPYSSCNPTDLDFQPNY